MINATFLRRFLAIFAALLATLFVVRQELLWRSERARYEAEIRAAKADTREAQGRQDRRAAELKRALAEIERRKREISSPKDIVEALPRDLPLPAPIRLPSEDPADPNSRKNSPAGGSPPAELPIVDLKPLHDFALICRACQVRLSATEADLADERRKRLAVERELAAQVKLARGGGFWRRTGRAAKWFLVGAAAGAIAASANR